MTDVEPASQPVEASHAWCLICRAPKPYRNADLEPASKHRVLGLIGNRLSCTGCGTTLATVYAKETAAA